MKSEKVSFNPTWTDSNGDVYQAYWNTNGEIVITDDKDLDDMSGQLIVIHPEVLFTIAEHFKKEWEANHD